MRINKIDNNIISFQSLRTDRDFVKQLAAENKYSLAENNQKNILKAIKNISEHGSISGVKFLMETARNLKYSTNIPFNISPKNKWKAVLMLAASACAVKAGVDSSKKINKEFKDIFYNNELNDDERDILGSYDSILGKMNGFNPDEKEYEYAKNNLEYFIISSETSLGDKKYILERLDYFLSDDYKINPQLENRRFQAFSEIINDLALDKVNSDIPNIKASNQNTHGMCTVFSLAGKLLAYEYKRNYTDFIIEELDASDTMTVYDRRELGKGKQIKVKKANIDYEGMLALGFRIIDAASANWMQIANIDNTTSNVTLNYIPYDKASFEVYNDSHIKLVNPDTKIAGEHDYITALSITEEALKRVKSNIIKQKLYTQHNRLDDKLKLVEEYKVLYANLSSMISDFLIDDYKDMTHDIVVGVMGLQRDSSKQIGKTTTVAPEYLYIDNEEQSIKQQKIKSYLNDRFGFAFNKNISNAEAAKVYTLIKDIRELDEPKKINQYAMAKAVIKAASAFRNQFTTGFLLPEKLHNQLVLLDIPDEDNVILDNINSLKQKVSADNHFIIESLSRNIGIEPSKEGVLEFLDLCADYVKTLPAVYDDLFRRMNLGSKNEVLVQELQTSLKVLDSDNDESKRNIMALAGIYDEVLLRARMNEALDLLTYRHLIDKYSQILNCEPDKENVLSNLKVLLAELSENNDKEKIDLIAQALGTYPENVIEELIIAGEVLSGLMDDIYFAHASELINQKTIKNDFISYYNSLVAALSQGVDKEFASELFINNGLEVDFSGENVERLAKAILDAIDGMANTVNTIAQNLYIEKDGDIINSVYYAHIVTGYYEKAGVLTKESVLNRFNKKFDDYAKLNAEKHKYSDKEYKRKKKELTSFTKQEKEELNKILSTVNLMYKITKQEKDMMFRLVRKDYEEIFREYGVNSGRYWVGISPSSGLSSDKEVALIESMTDKPYFIQNNLKKAFKDIKTGKFSGVTASSVSDRYPGLHAQYVASIDTIKIPSKSDPNKKIEKDVLFHDNTWGIFEKENNWIDSNGLTRTDYNNDYGYKYGYITNDLYRNGTFVDDLLYKQGQSVGALYNNKQLKRLNPSRSYSFELMQDVIMPGYSPKALSIAKAIRDVLFISDEDNLSLLESYAEEMSPEQLKHRIKILNNLDLKYNDVYNELERRIKGSRFNKGIVTEADYNALPNDDILKIMAERTALRKMFAESALKDSINSINNLNALGKLKSKMLLEARENFGYTFCKNLDIVEYLSSEHIHLDLFDKIIKPILQNNGIDYKGYKHNRKITRKEIQEQGYDGSLRSLAGAVSGLYTDKLIAVLGEDISVNAARDMREGIYSFVIKMFTLRPEDIGTGVLPQNVIDWIDKTYNPETNEEFVQIFNRIQNYTTEEYNRLVSVKVQDEDLTASVTGYDLIKSIRASREYAENALLNEIYNAEITKTLDLSTTKPYIRYDRYNKKITGAIYKEKKFDDIYLALRSELNSLVYNKMFKKHKEMAYKQYNVLPAYPQIDLKDSNTELVETSLKLVKSAQEKLSSYKQQLNVLDTADWIVDFIYNHANKELTYNDIYNLRKNVKDFIRSTAETKEFNEISVNLLKMLVPDRSIVVSEFLPVADKLGKTLDSLLKLSSREEYLKRIEIAKEDLDKSVDVFLSLKILPEYRDRVHGKINEWISALNNENPKAIDKYNELFDMSERYYIMNNPSKILDEYLYAIASDEEKKNKTIIVALGRSIESLLVSTKSIGIQEIVMSAVQQGITNIVAKEFDNVDIPIYKRNKDGKMQTEIVKMSSPEAIVLMLRPLLMEDNFEAAKNFVHKFNVVEKVVPVLMEIPEIKVIDDVLEGLEKTQACLLKEVNIVNDLKNKINCIPRDTSAVETKNICAGLIKELIANKHRNNIYIDNLISAYEGVLKSDVVDTLDGIPVSVFLNNVTLSSLTASYKDFIESISNLNNNFYNAQIIINFINELNLPDNRDLHAKVNEFRAWYEDVIERQNKCISTFNELEIL